MWDEMRDSVLQQLVQKFYVLIILLGVSASRKDGSFPDVISVLNGQPLGGV